MRTKLFTLIAAIAFTFGATNAFAQEGGKGEPKGSNQGTVNLTIELIPIQTLVVNETQKNVVLKYETQKDYADGVSSEYAEHLTVTSTGAYEVKVKAEKDVFETDDKTGLNVIPTWDVVITSSGAEGKTYSEKNLSGVEDKVIVESINGGVDQKINIKYAAKGGNEYLINNYVKGKKVTLTNIVTYTIAPK